MDNLTWQQLHSMIMEMRNKLETQQSVTRTVPRINYATLMSILTNQNTFMYDKSIHLKLNIQDGVISITLKKRGRAL